MDVADGGDRVDDLLVLEDEVQDERLRQDRVLRPHGDDGALHAFLPTLSLPIASSRARMALGENGTMVAVL